MLFENERHEALEAEPWDEAAVRGVITEIADDAERRFDPGSFWPQHPLDLDAESPQSPFNLYSGAAGVIWALGYLALQGAAPSPRDYAPCVGTIFQRNREWIEPIEPRAPSYVAGDVGVLMVGWQLTRSWALFDRLLERVRANLDHEANELFSGGPGTTLAALFMHERTGDPRWRELAAEAAERVWKEMREDGGCWLWRQVLLDRSWSFLGLAHGFAGNAAVLLRAAPLLGEACRRELGRRIAETLERTAEVEGELANWRQRTAVPTGEANSLIVEICHGAPGVIVGLRQLPRDSAIDTLLRQAGELVWTAGPLVKGPGLCHGTAGNGYAFLTLYRRTRDPLWLERARAFAMHAIGQWRRARDRHGVGRYTLWTGDPGLAVFLWHCVRARDDFPTLHVF